MENFSAKPFLSGFIFAVRNKICQSSGYLFQSIAIRSVHPADTTRCILTPHPRRIEKKQRGEFLMTTSIWKRAAERFSDFINHRGFAVITTICIGVITGTAVWTDQKHEVPYTAPTPPVINDVSAAHLMQESLYEAATPILQNTPAPFQWRSPLDELIVVQEFNDQVLKRSQDTGIWQVHDGIDLKAEPGDKVYAMEAGTVVLTDDSNTDSIVVQIAHSDGYMVIYNGLSALSAIRAGDQVHIGQTLGFAGGIVSAESSLGSHIHLEVLQDGIPVDPNRLLSP